MLDKFFRLNEEDISQYSDLREYIEEIVEDIAENDGNSDYGRSELEAFQNMLSFVKTRS